MKNEATKVSINANDLQKIVNLDLAQRSVKWEMFGTPEYSGGVPGPTDFITLIVEVTPGNDEWESTAPSTGSVWIAPESPRSWLSGQFYSMLEKQRNSTLDLSKTAHCRSIQTTLRQTGEPVKGFECVDSGKKLIYLRIADYSRS